MSAVEPAVKHRPWGESVATFFTCLALGPPIGGIIFTLGVTFSAKTDGVPAGAGLADKMLSALFVGLFAVPFSYILGGVQAAATGLAFAGYGWLRGRPPLWFAAATALVVYAGAYLSGMANNQDVAALFVVTHLVPAFLCWLIVRTYWRKAQS